MLTSVLGGGNGKQIEELQNTLTDSEISLIELGLIYEEIEFQMDPEESTLLVRANDLSDRLSVLKGSLVGLDSRLSSLSEAKLRERVDDIRQRLDILVEEREHLEEKALACRKVVMKANSPGERTGRLSKLVESGAYQLTRLVESITESLKASVSGVSNALGGILGVMASIEGGTLETRGLTSVAFLTLVLAVTLGGSSYLLQSYWSEGFSMDGVLFDLKSRLGMVELVIDEKAESTLLPPFWDPVPERVKGPSRNVGDVDREYIRILFELGYVREARAAIDSLEGPIISTVPGG